MRPVKCLAAALVAVALAAATPALAQPKGDPQPIKPTVEGPDIGAWAEAYEAYGFPRVLVLCGRTARSGEDGLFAPSSSGFAYQLKSAFEEIINDPDVGLDLIDVDSLVSATKRLGNALDMAAEPEAIRLLANELSADMVILIKFLDADPRANPGVEANMTFEVVDPSRGGKLVTFPFRWQRDDSVPWINRYANDLAVRFIDDFARRAPRPSWVEVRAIGFGDNPGHVKALRDGMTGMDRVESVRPPRSSTYVDQYSGQRQTLQTYRLRFAGDMLDLAAEIEDAQFDLDGREVRVVLLETSALTVKIVNQAPEVESDEPLARAQCEELILRPDEPGIAQRGLLQELYRSKNSPRFALLVNRAPTRAERLRIESEGGSISGDTVVLVQTGTVNQIQDGSGSGAVVTQTDDSELREVTALESQTNQIEVAMYNLLGTNLLGFKRIEPSIARARIAGEAEHQAGVFGESEIVEILRRENIADVIIFGRGTSMRESNGERRATYTFRAVSIADAEYLAGAIVSGRLGFANEKDLIERMAEQAIQSIACELIQEWSPPTEMAGMVKGARGSSDMDDFLKAIKKLSADPDDPGSLRAPGSSSFRDGADGGYFTVSLMYDCAFSELFDEFRRLSGELPYELEIETLETSNVVLRIVR